MKTTREEALEAVLLDIVHDKATEDTRRESAIKALSVPEFETGSNDDFRDGALFFNRLQFVEKVLNGGTKIALLAGENGVEIPGQCAIRIGPNEGLGVRNVMVSFETTAPIPEGCALSCNWKEKINDNN